MAATAQQVDFALSGVIGNSNTPAYDGKALAGGKIYFYDPGTTDTRKTWKEAAKTNEQAQPVILDTNGKAEIYADGLYDIKIDDADDVTVDTTDKVFYSAEAAAVFIIQSVSADTTLANTGRIVLVDSTAGDKTITLMSASDLSGEQLIVINVGANVVTVAADGSETISGASSRKLLDKWSTLYVQSDNTNWVENIPAESKRASESETKLYSIALIF